MLITNNVLCVVMVSIRMVTIRIEGSGLRAEFSLGVLWLL